jgi:hypothetical protein
MSISTNLRSASFSFVFFYLLTLSSLLGDEAVRDLEFRVFSLNRKAISGLYYNIGPQEIAPLKFTSRRRSEPHPFRGPPIITFFRKSTGITDAEPVYEVVGSVNISSNAQEPLFFFLPLNATGLSGKTNYRILAMEDSPSAFPYGHIRVLNASGAPLSGRVGDQDIKLGFEVTPPWPSRSLFSGDGNWINLALFVQVRNDFEMVYANQLTFASDARSILVIRPPRRENSIKVTTFILEDYKKPEETGQITSLR